MKAVKIDEEQQQDSVEGQGLQEAILESKEEKLQCEAPTTESSSEPICNADNKKVSREDIQLVQNLIERCIQLYMNQAEVIKTLLNQAKIEPGFTSLVWQKLEEQNRDFFKAYYTRLKLKKQILLFNRLLEQQSQIMRLQGPATDSMASVQNGMHHSSVHHPPMGYPVFHQNHLPAAGHPHPHPHPHSHSHMVPMSCGISNQPVVNGIPAQGGYLPVSMASSTDNVADGYMEANAVMPNTGNVAPSVSEFPPNQDSVMPTGPFPFHSTEMSIPLDLPFLSSDSNCLNGSCTSLQGTSDVAGKDSLRSLSQPLPSFSLLDLTADLSSGDLGTLGSYSGSPFLSQEADDFLDSPDNDEIDEDFFIDSITDPCYKSEEEKVG